MLIRNVEPLKGRMAPLDMTAAGFRSAGHGVVDQIADWLETLPDGPVTHAESPGEIRRVLDAERQLPESGCDARALLDEAAGLLFRHSLFNGHPRFFGYITSSPAPIGALGDLLASAVNQNVGAFQLSPLATEIEAQTVRWIAELIGFPSGAGGLLVSGVGDAFFTAEGGAVPANPDRDARGRHLIAAVAVGAIGALARIEHDVREVEPPRGEAEALQRFRCFLDRQRTFERALRLLPGARVQRDTTGSQIRERLRGPHGENYIDVIRNRRGRGFESSR